MMNSEQNRQWLMQYLGARKQFPWIASCAEDRVRQALNEMGGMAGSWRSDYPACTYYHPCRIDGGMVDLSTIAKVKQFYESKPLQDQ